MRVRRVPRSDGAERRANGVPRTADAFHCEDARLQQELQLSRRLRLHDRKGTRRNGIRSFGVAPPERLCPMKTPKKPRAQDKQDGDERLSFDPTTLPAAVDFHAFARRTGEIIARAARALLGRRVKR